jgi:GT2 family glycosyltransferase
MKAECIICTYNRPKELRVLLENLINYINYYDNIIIVDSSDKEDSRKLIREFQAIMPIKYIISAKGLTIQRNIGINNISPLSNLIFFFDDDVTLYEDYFYQMINFFINDKRKDYIGACGNALNEKKRKFFDILIRRFFFITDNTTGKKLLSGDAGHIFDPLSDIDVEVLSGCNMCYRSEIFFKYGLRFDEKLTNYSYMEDQDFSIRASKYGKLRQLKSAKIIHHVSSSARMDYKKWFEMYVINSYYLLQKNYSPKLINYLAYSWRLAGKLFHASFLSIKKISLSPLLGFFNGIACIIQGNLNNEK